jgi:hypothetical protein
MNRASKIFTAGISNNINTSFKLLSLAEGFGASQEMEFYSAVRQLTQQIVNTHPFRGEYATWL